MAKNLGLDQAKVAGEQLEEEQQAGIRRAEVDDSAVKANVASMINERRTELKDFDFESKQEAKVKDL